MPKNRRVVVPVPARARTWRLCTDGPAAALCVLQQRMLRRAYGPSQFRGRILRAYLNVLEYSMREI